MHIVGNWMAILGEVINPDVEFGVFPFPEAKVPLYFGNSLAIPTYVAENSPEKIPVIIDFFDKMLEPEYAQIVLKKIEMISEYNPGEFIYLLENTSTTLVSPEQYRKYNLKHICEYRDIIDGTDNYYILHMCGLLKNLLPDLNKTNAVAFEAFTSYPVGDTDLIDGRNTCPDKCLIGGTNAYLWTKSSDEIIETIERELEKLPSHRGIVITSAGVMPPVTKPGTIKEVCDWLKGYKVRL